MRAIISLFDFTGCIGRKAFWTAWTVHLLLSCALIAVFLLLDTKWPGGAAVFVLVGLRLLLIGPQMSLYVRRLRDSREPGWWVVFLLGLYAVMSFICLWWAFPAAQADEECRLTGFDNCGDAGGFAFFASVAGLGPLTGFPGPLSLLFAIGVGSAKSKRPSGG